MHSEDIELLLSDHQPFHSQFQMDWLVTSEHGGPTAYGMYKQALRELDKRYRAVFGHGGLLDEQRELDEGIARLERWCGRRWPRRPSRRRRKQEELRRKRVAAAELAVVSTDTFRELDHFYKQAKELKAAVGELTTERRAELDQEMWRIRLMRMAALDIAVSGRPDRNIIEALMAMPKAWRQESLAAMVVWCADPGKALEWLDDQEVEVLPWPGAIAPGNGLTNLETDRNAGRSLPDPREESGRLAEHVRPESSDV